MKTNYLYILLVAVVFSSCAVEEDQLEPSGIKSGYTVPQGNNDYDDYIVDFYNAYDSYLLYDFTEKDAYWTPLKWNNGVESSEDETGKTGFIVEMPDLNYIKPQLELLKRTWFDHYNDEFLDQFLPIKILLCSQVKYCNYDFSSWPFQIKASNISAYFNFDNISVSYARAEVETISAEEEAIFQRAINRVFIDCMVGQEKLNPTAEFTQSVNYSNASYFYTNTGLWSLGILQPYYQASSKNDWNQFVTMMIAYSEEYLNREVDSVNDWDTSESSWEGIFTALKDSNGLLKERYNMVRQYYIDNYNIDLQVVGNTIYQE